MGIVLNSVGEIETKASDFFLLIYTYIYIYIYICRKKSLVYGLFSNM